LKQPEEDLSGWCFDFKFPDEQIDSFYKSEARLFTLFKIFAVMAMVICCLGLWAWLHSLLNNA
jgi:hypothetical protein